MYVVWLSTYTGDDLLSKMAFLGSNLGRGSAKDHLYQIIG